MAISLRSFRGFSRLVSSATERGRAASSLENLTVDYVLHCRWNSVEESVPDLALPLLIAVVRRLHPHSDLVLTLVQQIHLQNLELESIAASELANLRWTSPAVDVLKQAITGGKLHSCADLLEALRAAGAESAEDFPGSLPVLALFVRALWKVDEELDTFYSPKIDVWNGLLGAFRRTKRLGSVWRLYAEMLKMKIQSNTGTFNIMTNVLCKEGELRKAEAYLQTMETSGVQPTVITYNTIIHGHCERGRVDIGLEIPNSRREKGIHPDLYTYGTLISGLYKQGKLEEASAMFSEMEENGIAPTTITFNALIDGDEEGRRGWPACRNAREETRAGRHHLQHPH